MYLLPTLPLTSKIYDMIERSIKKVMVIATESGTIVLRYRLLHLVAI